VLFGCCTNLIGFYRRIGAFDKIHWTSDMIMIEPGGRRSTLRPTPLLPAPLHGLPRLLTSSAFSMEDKLSLARAFRAMLRPVPRIQPRPSPSGSRATVNQGGAIERFWKLVIASALNAEIESIAVPYAAKVIRELFMNSAEPAAWASTRSPLSQLYAGVEPLLTQHASSVHLIATSSAWSGMSRFLYGPSSRVLKSWSPITSCSAAI